MKSKLFILAALCLVGNAAFAQKHAQEVYADGPFPYEFINEHWTYVEGHVEPENITYNDDNTITLKANEAGIGADDMPYYSYNASLGNSTQQSQWNGITTEDYYTTLDQQWFIIVGTDLSTEVGDSYLWWLNGVNKASSVPQDYTAVLDDGRVLLAWDVTKSGLDDNLQDYINYQNGWTCFGLTPISKDGVTIISDICFYTWEEALAKYPELENGEATPDNTNPYEFINTMWVTGDTGRLTSDNITYNSDNTITAQATLRGYGDNNEPLYTYNICFGNSTGRGSTSGITTADFSTTIDQSWLVVVGTDLSTVSDESYLWWLNGTNRGTSVEPIYAIELESGNRVLIAWEVTMTGLDSRLQSDVNLQDGWTCFGLTPTTSNGISTISDISFYTWAEAIAKYPELVAVGGTGGPSTYYLALQSAVEEAQAAYPTETIDELIAGKDAKEAYLSALDAAQALLANSSPDEYDKNDEFVSAADDLSSAMTALQTSITQYAGITSLIDEINSTIDKAYEYGWLELVDELQDIVDNLRNGYEDETLTSEQIDSAEDDVANAIADYISEYVQPGDDITMVIRNPNFDTDISGWTIDGSTPTFGGNGTAFGGGANTVEGGVQPSDLGGDVELTTAMTDISQVIKNMPEGLYTLSCSGFARDDGGDGIQAFLYASVNGNEQTQTFVSLYSEGSPDMLYDSSSYPDVTAILNNGELAYVPDGMAGANVYFYLGYYQNKFNILVEERGDLTIGVRKTSTNDWLIFDNFKLVYQGNDASVYAELIEELIEQAVVVQGNGIMSNEADQRIIDAINQGYDAIDLVPADKDVSLAAVQSLREAISAGEASINLILDLEYLANYTNDSRLSELDSSINDEILEVIEEVFEALDSDGFETDAEVQGYIDSLKGTYNKCAIYDHLDATESAPADVSIIILTRDCLDANGEDSHYGWTPTDDSVITGERYGLIEFYDIEAGAGIEQVLFNLYAGWYRLGVQAFYRPGNTYSTTCPIEMTKEENDTVHLADFYAGSKATRIRSIFSDAEEYSAQEGRTTYITYSIPNSMTEASYAFDDDLYHNTLQFEVTADGTDVPIGLRKTGHISGDWLIWSHWTLEYVGGAEPTIDPTTAIESVEGTGSVVATAIYGLSGTKQSHLTKGVNIVKETLSDGTVNVTKVLVK